MEAMRVADLMTTDVVTMDPGEPVAAAARRMHERNVGCVVVVERGRVVGLVTDRHVALALGRDSDVHTLPVREVMTKDPVTCHPEHTLADAAHECFSKGPFRRLPVVDGEGMLVGVVSVADMALAAHAMLEAILAETGASVKEAQVSQGGAKRELERTVPRAVM